MTTELRRRVRSAALVCGALLATWAVPAGAQPAALPAARPADVGLSAERLARLDAAMQAEVDAGRKAGIVTLIARRGPVAHLKAYGMAERESGTPMRTDSVFRLYSMTKPITSVALLMLYEEGKFQLSDPLEKYIPAFEAVQVLAGMDGERMRLEPPRRKPTIHDVFRHTAGFSYGFNPQTPISAGSTGYGLGVSVMLDPALAGNLGSKGTFGWSGAASTWAILDREEDLVLILMAQYLVADADFAGRFQTLAYQAIVD